MFQDVFFVLLPFQGDENLSLSGSLPLVMKTKSPKVWQSVRAFKQYFAQYLFHHPDTNTLEDPKTLPKTFDPSVTYFAYHHAFRAYDRGMLIAQQPVFPSFRRTFEERAIRAVERHLTADPVVSRWQAVNPKREEGWRYLTGKIDIAEWDGIWQREDGHIYPRNETFNVHGK